MASLHHGNREATPRVRLLGLATELMLFEQRQPAAPEKFFGHLKEELFNRVRFLNTDALTAALHDYIHWYNTGRISTKLNGLSPAQYLVKALVAWSMSPHSGVSVRNA